MTAKNSICVTTSNLIKIYNESYCFMKTKLKMVLRKLFSDALITLDGGIPLFVVSDMNYHEKMYSTNNGF